jgi:hypothetical protein
MDGALKDAFASKPAPTGECISNVGAGAACDLFGAIGEQDQKIAAFGSSYRGMYSLWERACSRKGPQDHRRSPPSFTSIFTIAANAFRKKTIRCRINLIPVETPHRRA